MRNASLYRIGGYAVLVAAIAMGAAMLMHAPQPADLAKFSALPMGTWMAVHWIFAVASVVLAGGLTAFARHMSRTDGEGWSVLGLAANLVTAALFVAIVAPEILGFDMLRAMNTDGNNAGAQHAFLAIDLNLMSMVHVGGPLFWMGVGFYALAMLKDASWPKWMGQAGVAIAAIEIASNWVLAEHFLRFKVVFALGLAWLALAGFFFSRFAGTADARGVTAPHGAYKASEGVPTR